MGNKIQKIYIGDHYLVYPKWKPGANTVAYYPLTSTTTTTDQSGNGNNLTNSNVVFGTSNGVDCATISGNSTSTAPAYPAAYLYGSITGLPTGAGARTFSYWVYNANASITAQGDETYIFQGQGSTNKMVLIASGHDFSGEYGISQRGSGHNFGTILRQQWCHHVITYDGSKFTWYINGTSRGTWSYTINTGNNTLNVGGNYDNRYWNLFNGSFSYLIVEKVAWTDQEVADYYNSTKGNYGL